MQSLTRRFIAYKYTILFSAMIMLIGVMPFLEQQQGLLVPIFMLIMILAVLDTLDLPKTLFRTCVVVGIVAFVFHLVGKILGGAAQAQEEVAILLIIRLGIYAVFLFMSVGAMIGKIGLYPDSGDQGYYPGWNRRLFPARDFLGLSLPLVAALRPSGLSYF